jgi:sigma-70-like protein
VTLGFPKRPKQWVEPAPVRKIECHIELAEMKDKQDTPRNNFTPALEAIGNLTLQDLNGFFYGASIDAQIAHDEIKLALINHRRGHFYRHFVPLRQNLVSLLSGSCRRLFKLALVHPRQVGRDPHEWACVEVQPFVGLALEWIRDWYILACDGENRFVRHLASTEWAPGQEVSLSVPTTAPPFPPPESWRAPAWLFGVSPLLGIGPLKTEHVPARDSEQRLGAAHTRLLLKGARRVFLWELGAAIETVRNEEIIAAGTIPTEHLGAERPDSTAAHQPKGFEGLGPKKTDLSRYMHNMTEKQQMAFSLKYEYELKLADIASRMGVDRKTAYEHFQAANMKIDWDHSSERRKANRAKDAPDE